MMTFDELMATNPPRVEVHFRRAPDGSEQFQWGITDGGVPVLTMIGAIVRAQAELPLTELGDTRHSHNSGQSFVLAYESQTRSVVWAVGPDIPVDPLIGMLETIKDLLVSGHMAQRVTAQQSRLLGPSGSPIR